MCCELYRKGYLLLTGQHFNQFFHGVFSFFLDHFGQLTCAKGVRYGKNFNAGQTFGLALHFCQCLECGGGDYKGGNAELFKFYCVMETP